MATMEKCIKSKKALDFPFDRSNIRPFMMDRIHNTSTANRILMDWAQVLVNGLLETGVRTAARP